MARHEAFSGHLGADPNKGEPFVSISAPILYRLEESLKSTV